MYSLLPQTILKPKSGLIFAKLFGSTFCRINNITDANVGNSIRIKGWIKSKRNMKKILFFDVNDGSGPSNLQVLVEKDINKNIGYGSSVTVAGVLSKSPSGQLELNAQEVCVTGQCPLQSGYPFVSGQRHPPEYIREHLHLRPRVNTMSSIFRVRHHAAASFNEELSKNGFWQIHTPIITSNDCEGGGEVFIIQPDNKKLLLDMAKQYVPIDQAYFDKKAFLTVSAQLHLEAMCHGLGNVYSFGPTFRAENSKTPIHLSEFYMLEVEQSFVTKLSEVTNLIEMLLKDASAAILNKCDKDLFHAATLAKVKPNFEWLNKPFPTISYDEAIAILERHSDKIVCAVNSKDGLSKEQELFLVQHIGSPVFVVNWPREMKPFYMRPCEENDGARVEAIDLLAPFVGELAGGSIREDNYERLKGKLPPGMEWYLDLRKFGGITTGGFGIGFERYLQFLLGIPNIKDVIPFPRWAHNCSM